MPLLRPLGGTVLVLAILVVSCVAARSQQQKNVPPGTATATHKQTVERINGGRVGIISGGIGGTYVRIAADLASVLDDGDDLRILPVLGKGSVQNITDMLYLRGIDVAIVQSDVLSYLKRQAEFRDIATQIHFIAKLYDEDVHLVASNKIGSVRDLAGKRVNVGIQGSGTFMTATAVFKALGVEIVPVNYDQDLALDMIKRGEIAATVYVAGKPARALASLRREDGYRLLPIPYTGALQATYLPASLRSEDYPDLLKGSQPVKTIAVGAVMAVFNWRPGSARYGRIVKFVDAFFSNLAEFQKPPHNDRWQEVDLHAAVPGWTRFPAAAEWLTASKPKADGATKNAFQQFVSSQSVQSGGRVAAPPDQEALFRQFIRWKQNTGQ